MQEEWLTMCSTSPQLLQIGLRKVLVRLQLCISTLSVFSQMFAAARRKLNASWLDSLLIRYREQRSPMT